MFLIVRLNFFQSNPSIGVMSFLSKLEFGFSVCYSRVQYIFLYVHIGFFSRIYFACSLQMFFNSSFFSSTNWTRSFVFVTTVKNFNMSRCLAVIPSKAHSYSIFISLHQKSSGVSVLVSLVQKNSPLLR